MFRTSNAAPHALRGARVRRLVSLLVCAALGFIALTSWGGQSGPFFRESEPNNGVKSTDKLGRATTGPKVAGHLRPGDVDLFELVLDDPGVPAPWNVSLHVTGWTEAPMKLVLLQPYDGEGSAVIMCGAAWVDGTFDLPDFPALYRAPVFTRLIVRVEGGVGDYVVGVKQQR